MGLLRGVAGTATAVSGRVSRRQANKAVEHDAQMAQLQKLGQLHDQGVLTDEEFTAKKQQILGL
jgi:hypothetical protein